jgi:hypothetical protein
VAEAVPETFVPAEPVDPGLAVLSAKSVESAEEDPVALKESVEVTLPVTMPVPDGVRVMMGSTSDVADSASDEVTGTVLLYISVSIY